MNPLNISNFSKDLRKSLFVVDNFYSDPYAIREFALNQQFDGDLRYYKGKRTKERFEVPGTKEMFESIMGQKITAWEQHGMNGVFQWCNPEDSLVYHMDNQRWAGTIYLTPNAPYECGTSFFAHKQNKLRRDGTMEELNVCFSGGFYDKTKFDLVDTVGNIFNRLVIFDARMIHAASQYFGQTIQDSRLFQMFFFD